VSILKVTGEDSYERISGTSLGGGTLWGLLSLITEAKTYDEMLLLSKSGDNKNVDMLVGDIYGGDYSKIGLKSTTIASSFGKVFQQRPQSRKNFRPEDISRSLLYMVSNNIGQIAYLNASAHGVQRIYFGGCFIRGHPITMNTLSFAIDFWSKGKMKALFLRHEGYLGAMGAFLKHVPTPTGNRSSFCENFSHSEKITEYSLSAVGVLDTVTTLLRPFPLLKNIDSYNPDTLDLGDSKLQMYWMDLLEKNLRNLLDLALNWQPNLNDDKLSNGMDRIRHFEDLFKGHLQTLRKEPTAYGNLSVRR